MNRHDQLKKLLPSLLDKYDHTKHGAIIETFAETLEEGMEAKEVKDLLLPVANKSKAAKNAAKKQLACWGMEL